MSGIYKKQMDHSLADLVLKPKSKKIARPPNAFMIFAREHRKNFSAQNPNQNNKVISKMLGNAWKKVDVQTKKMYFEKAKQLELLHKQKYPDYFYSPRIARLQKLKRSMRRARLKLDHDSDEEEIKIEEAKPKKLKIQEVANYIKNDKEEENFDLCKETKSPEYVPNNPDYFKEPDHISGGTEESIAMMPFQVQSSDHSSGSSLCSGYDVRSEQYPYFHPEIPRRCSCSHCDKYWQRNMLHKHVDPFWNNCSRSSASDFRNNYMHSSSPEPDGFRSFSPLGYPHYQRPFNSGGYYPLNFPSASFNRKESMSANYPFFGPSHWQQPWRPPMEEDHFCYQNLDYNPRSHYDFKCCSSNWPHPYPNKFRHSQWKNEERSSQLETYRPSEATRQALTGGLHLGCEEGTESCEIGREIRDVVDAIPDVASTIVYDSTLFCENEQEGKNQID